MDFLVLRDRRQRTMGMAMAMTIPIMVMVVDAAAICTRFRLEPRTFLHHGGAEAFQHFLQHAVLVNAQKTIAYLGLGMAVAKMKRAPKQVVRRIANYPVCRFFRRHDLDYPAVISLEQVIMAQHSTPGRKNGYLFSRGKRRPQPAVFAKLVGKYEPRENRVRMLYF
jgi:hypothetical protein